MQKKFFASAILCLIILSACSRTAQEPTQEQPQKEPEYATQSYNTGEIPFEYPKVETTAEEGQYVLAPSADTVEQALTKSGKNTIFTFYAATLIEAGKEESIVEDLLGEQYSLPNSLIIPIQKSESTTPGALVLTWWQGGSGMMRGIVTELEKDTNLPTARYLDSFADKPEKLLPNSYQLLTDTIVPGAPVIIKTGEQYEHATIVNIADDKALVSGFAGFLHVKDFASISPIVVNRDLKEGDVAYGPIFGIYQPITIKTSNPEIGQVTAEYTFAEEQVTKVFYLDEVVTELP